MKTAQTKVAVISNSLLAAVGRVLGGIDIHNQPPLALPLQKSVGRALKRSVQGLEPGLVAKNVILQPRHHGLARSRLVAFADGKAKGWIDSEIISVVAVLVAGSYLVDPLTDHLDQGMPGVYGRPSVFEAITHGADDVETLVHLPQRRKPVSELILPPGNSPGSSGWNRASAPLFGCHHLRASDVLSLGRF